MNCLECMCNLCVFYSLNPDSASLLLMTMRKAPPYGWLQIKTLQIHGEFPRSVEHTYAVFFWLGTGLYNYSFQIWSVNQYKLLTLWTPLECFVHLQMAFASCGAVALDCWNVNFCCCNSIQRFEGHRVSSSGRIQDYTGLLHFVLMPFLHPLHTDFRLPYMSFYLKPLVSSMEVHFSQNKSLIICNT